MTTFREKLASAVKQNDSLVCVGLDPDPALMPIDDVVLFCRKIVEATSGSVCAFKPNLAFFEALGVHGWEVLAEVLRAVPSEIPVIGDAKRGDIGNSSAGYAKAVLEELGCDAMTVNAWGGHDSIEPFLEHADKGVIIWCRSSNPSAIDFQDLEVNYNGGRRPLWQVVALKAREWDKRGNVGIVMGATYPAQLKEARVLCPEMPMLVPGIGAQEGALRDAVRAGLDANGEGIIVNASRSVLYAARDSDYAMAAHVAAEILRGEINNYRRDAIMTLEG
jgi:orotidine-5'-phosphate decarboxylase